MINLTPNEYESLCAEKAPKSKTLRNALRAFVCGGLVCVLGQAVRDLFERVAQDSDAVSALVCVTLIALSATLTFFHLYDDFARYAGAGALVPVTGFANAVCSSAAEYRTEGLITGTAVKLFCIAGPVIVYGNIAGIAYGLVYWLLGNM